MPVIKILHVCSSSSEKPNQPAENLLDLESYKKWSCAEPGEKKATVVLQLEKSSCIHALDIGNNGSAFVEVLVGHSTSPDVYEVLLGMSTFMSVSESKQWTNVNRVRMFGKEKFTKDVAAKKWDRVKVVCTQPYNKSERYGLSFIKLHSPPESAEATPTSATPTTSTTAAAMPAGSVPVKLGKFSLKEESGELPSGSLFFKKGPLSLSPPGQGRGAGPGAGGSSDCPNAAAQARMASAAALRGATSSLSSAPGSSVQRSKVTTSPTSSHHPHVKTPPVPAHHAHKTAPPTNAHSAAQADDGAVARRRHGDGGGVGGGAGSKRPMTTAHEATPNSKKPRGSAEESPRGRGREVGVSVPFSQLLEGVVFVLSGFKNPFRATLRGKGLEMGAVYEADWSPSCTHLICAFPNTPKFNQVKGKGGLIVMKEWILDCHAKKRRLPAKRYRLSSGTGDSSSEDDRYDSKEAAIFKPVDATTTAPPPVVGEEEEEKGGRGKDSGGQKSSPGGVGVAEKEEEDPYAASTDEEDDVVVKSKPPASPGSNKSSEAVDTEDEIRRIRQRNPGNAMATDEYDPYDASTDEEVEMPPSSSGSLTDLPDFLSATSCFLYGQFSPSDRRLLTRYITAYGGHVADYMGEKVTHVVTMEDWDENFDQAVAENSRLAFVRPQWVFECHHQQQCISQDLYEVAPK